jgi:hypothetical protein
MHLGAASVGDGKSEANRERRDPAGTIASARAFSPLAASMPTTRPRTTSAIPMKNIAVASEMPASPTARCVAGVERASRACTTRSTVQAKNKSPCTCTAAGISARPATTGTTYVGAKPTNATAANTKARPR